MRQGKVYSVQFNDSIFDVFSCFILLNFSWPMMIIDSNFEHQLWDNEGWLYTYYSYFSLVVLHHRPEGPWYRKEHRGGPHAPRLWLQREKKNAVSQQLAAMTKIQARKHFWGRQGQSNPDVLHHTLSLGSLRSVIGLRPCVPWKADCSTWLMSQQLLLAASISWQAVVAQWHSGIVS